MENIQKTVSEIADALEEQVDEEINRLESLTVDDFDHLRVLRLARMKKAEEQKRKWLELGHGLYSEIPDEKYFFDVSKKSERVVVHFYRDGSMPCKIVDMHLKLIAPKHLETKFVSLNAPKCPFLATRLHIKILPTIVTIINNKTVDRIEGFTELGNKDDFPTRVLEWRLAQSKGINYDGDLTEPPLSKEHKTRMNIRTKKAIREEDTDSDDDTDLSGDRD